MFGMSPDERTKLFEAVETGFCRECGVKL